MGMLAPAFDESGKVSWFSAERIENSFIRFGAFVENTCPLFARSALDQFMSDIYSPTLKGWGVDLLYMWHFNSSNVTAGPRTTGVLDAVVINNPPLHKNGIRDIEQNFPDRKQNWLIFLEHHGLS